MIIIKFVKLKVKIEGNKSRQLKKNINHRVNQDNLKKILITALKSR